MRNLRHLFLLLCLSFCLLAGLAASAVAAPFSSHVIIGDDLLHNADNALLLKATRHTLDVFDATFQDLPCDRKAIVHAAELPPGVYGATSFLTCTILISTECPRPDETIAHEFSHFIDHMLFLEATHSAATGIIQLSMASSYPATSGLTGWFNAALGTQRIKDFTALSTLFADDPLVMRTAHYYMNVNEAFARSLSQWICYRSGDALLKTQMDDQIHTWNCGQWTDEDFKPVGAAIETYFNSHHWLKAKPS